MIDASHKLAPLVNGLALERRPIPVEQPQPARDEPSESHARRSPSEVEAAQALLARHARQQNGIGANASEASSLRSRRALDAYFSHQHSDERDYVARVLGVDEYA